MNQLFEILNPRIFTVFSREDRNANYDLLSVIYDLFTKGERRQTISRDDLVDDLTAYIQSRDFGSLEDEEGEDIATKSAKDKTVLKIKQFKKAGWLEEDPDETHQFTVAYSLNDNALKLLQVFREIVSQQDRPLEYTGYFYTVYSLLQTFEFNEAKARLEQIEKNTVDLFNSLQGLSSTIRRFIEEMINRPDITPEEVLDTLLYKYQDQVVLTAFNSLKGKDNPSKYTSGILVKLRAFRYNREDFERIVDSFATHTSGLTGEKYKELEKSVADGLDDCIAKFESVNDFVSLIDRRNMKFHNSVLARLKFLINTRRDVNGLLDSALKALAKADPKESFEDVVGVYSTVQIDDRSTYSRSFDKEKITYSPSEIPNVSDEEIQKEEAHLFDEDAFSKEKVNEFASEVLGDRNKVSSKDIDQDTKEKQFLMLMLELYSEYDDMCYTVTFRNDYYAQNGFREKEFEICRKEEKR